MTENIFTAEIISEIDAVKNKFPTNQTKSAIIESLLILQDKNDGYLDDAIISGLAKHLKVNKIDIYEVATFYSMFSLQPIGKNVIAVCTNVSCMLRGSDDIVAYLEKKLKIKLGESTKDNKFYLKNEMECLAACNGAPMMQVNHVNHENLTYEQIDEIIKKLNNE